MFALSVINLVIRLKIVLIPQLRAISRDRESINQDRIITILRTILPMLMFALSVINLVIRLKIVLTHKLRIISRDSINKNNKEINQLIIKNVSNANKLDISQIIVHQIPIIIDRIHSKEKIEARIMFKIP